MDVGEHPVPTTTTVSGTLRGERQTELAASASGRVVSTFVERGSEVRAGDVIARLDVRAAALTAAEARAQARAASVQADAARVECERATTLRARGALSPQEYEHLAMQCRTSDESREAARARAASASQMVSNGVVRAPFAGTVIERHVNVGEYVHEDSRVVSLVTTSALRIELSVPEARLATLAPGLRVTFTVASHPGRTFEATVRLIGQAVREATRDVVVEADVAAVGELLRPGMFAVATVPTGEQLTAIVAASALVPRPDGVHVFVVREGRAEERTVELGPRQGDEVAVRRGVQVGERVVRQPPADLRNGQEVE